MQCPNCNETLLLTERKNVEIDYCPKCRGVWLDKGELDKIIEFSEGAQPQKQQRQDEPQPTFTDNKNWKNKHSDDDDDDDYRENRNKQYPNGLKKKSSFLGDLFDF